MSKAIYAKRNDMPIQTYIVYALDMHDPGS